MLACSSSEARPLFVLDFFPGIRLSINWLTNRALADSVAAAWHEGGVGGSEGEWPSGSDRTGDASVLETKGIFEKRTFCGTEIAGTALKTKI